MIAIKNRIDVIRRSCFIFCLFIFVLPFCIYFFWGHFVTARMIMCVQQFVRYMAQWFFCKVIVECLNFRIVMSIAQAIGSVFGIVGIDTCLAYPVLWRYGSAWLTAAGNTSARTSHDFHKLKLTGASFYFFAQFTGI